MQGDDGGDGNDEWGMQEDEAGEPAIQLCEIVSGGEAEYAECVFPVAYKAVLDWFEEVAAVEREKEARVKVE